MDIKRRPDRRDCAPAQPTPALIEACDRREREKAPLPVIGRDKRLSGARLIDLERRARFVQRAS